MNSVTKIEVLAALKTQAKEQKALLEKALAESKEDADGDQTKSEGKYDTRAVEASYLVNAQEEQLAQMEENLILLERFDPPSYQITDAIGPGALSLIHI